MEELTTRSTDDSAKLMFGMRLSLVASFVLLVVKVAAAWWSHSVAVFSDAAESVAHVFAVGFALFSLHLSLKPADETHPYGHAKISFFSSAFEGAMILAAAVFVVYESAVQLAGGPALQSPELALVLTVVVIVLNGALGGYLVRLGRRRNSIVLEANGHHVLTDCYTSLGVVVGLLLAWTTGWNKWDPVCAIVVSVNMAWTAWRLISRSVHGLMDHADPALRGQIDEVLARETRAAGVTFHALRHRHLGDSLWADVHLVFPSGVLLRDAHRTATRIERAVNDALGPEVFLTTHLESAEDHDVLHATGTAGLERPLDAGADPVGDGHPQRDGPPA